MNKLLFILLFSSVTLAQINSGCLDDDDTMQLGLSVWTSDNITGCEDGIVYLNSFGYGCNTYLPEINNPFWGSNPNETIANICSCTCEEIVIEILGCLDLDACNYNSEATDNDGSCIYANIGYDCEENCLNDIDNDGFCDEFDDCLYNEISVLVQGEDSEIGWNITETDGGGWASASGGLGIYENLCLIDGCWNFNMYGSNDGWADTYYSIFYSPTNELISSGTLPNGNFCGVQIQIGDSASCTNIDGCTDYDACNYDCSANADDGNCIYPDPGYDCIGGCITDLDQDGICEGDCIDFDYLVVDCECSFLDPATYTIFFTNVDEDNCLIIEDCYCECINDWDNDGICDENEQEGCADTNACNYDPNINPYGFDDGSCIYPGDECVAGILEGGELIYGMYNEDCICMENNSFIEEPSIPKEIIKVIDLLGRETQQNGFIIKIYNNGTVERSLPVLNMY